MAHCGREAYGAASLGACRGPLPLDDDPPAAGTLSGADNAGDAAAARDDARPGDGDGEIAPMVAYAKSQGLYFGVSVDGLKFFTRHDLNART